MAESLWRVMKKRILKDYNDKTIDDENCIIPRDMVEEFIEEVESLIPNKEYKSINWRTIIMFHDILNGAPGRETWKEALRDELSRK